MTMTDSFRNIIPQIEGRLYSWGKSLDVDRPDAAISTIYSLLGEYGTQGPTTQKYKPRTSPQERWAIKHYDMLHNAATIKRALGKMPLLDRKMIVMRYVGNRTWKEIADATGEGEVKLKGPIKERALYLIASEFELLNEAG